MSKTTDGNKSIIEKLIFFRYLIDMTIISTEMLQRKETG